MGLGSDLGHPDQFHPSPRHNLPPGVPLPCPRLPPFYPLPPFAKAWGGTNSPCAFAGPMLLVQHMSVHWPRLFPRSCECTLRHICDIWGWKWKRGVDLPVFRGDKTPAPAATIDMCVQPPLFSQAVAWIQKHLHYWVATPFKWENIVCPGGSWLVGWETLH